MKKRIFALLLATFLLFCLVSCADDPAGEPNESQPAQTDGGTEAPDPNRGGEEQDPDGGTSGGDEQKPDDGSTPGGDGEQDSVREEKSIDIYLIAGQSNASGYTRITSASSLYERAPDLKTGYSNVHYAGNARSDKDSYATLVNNQKSWRPVTLSLGRADGYFGPEAGMAQSLSAYYNEETGKHAGIIKLAHGGTCLLNSTSGSNQHGNWVSPSYAEHLGVTYASPVGGLYNALVEEVRTQIAELEEYGGFTHVNIVGLYWMQGENDRGNPTEYEKAFGYFVDDLRISLSAVAKRFNGDEDDGGASRMAVFVGSVSETFSAATESNIASNRTFIEMQKGLAETIENCYFVDNSAYAINQWNGTESVVVGSDRYHWNQEDALSIGINVGIMILENCTDYRNPDEEMWEELFDSVTGGDGNEYINDEHWTDFY